MDRGKVSAAEENWRARMQHLHFAAPVPAARLACVVSAAATAPGRFGRGKGRRDWADGARRAAGAKCALRSPGRTLYCTYTLRAPFRPSAAASSSVSPYAALALVPPWRGG